MAEELAHTSGAWGDASDACLQLEGCIAGLQAIMAERLNDPQSYQALALLIRAEQLNNLVAEFIAAEGAVDSMQMSQQVLGRVAASRQHGGPPYA